METTRSDDRIRSEGTLLVAAAAAYLLFLGYFVIVLKFDLLTADAHTYWRDSLNWSTPFSAWWVPGYPLLIAAVRGVTFGKVPPIAIMVGISAISYLVAVSAVRRLAVRNGFRRPFFAGLLFAMFPLVGLVYSVFPLADITAIALLLLAVSSLQGRQWRRFVIACGACMMVQKVMWFFVPPLMLLAFVKHGESRRLVPWAVLPLLVWMVLGAMHHRDPIWFMRWSYENLFVPKGSLPILDGIVTPILSGSPAKIAKGVLVGGLAVLVAILAVHGWRHKHWIGLCAALSLLAMIAVVNSYEIWVVIRYSKVLIIPLTFVEAGFLDSWPKGRTRAAALLTLAICLASNLAFGFYLTRYMPDM